MGFEVAQMKGSQNNDAYQIEKGQVVSLTDNAGGVLGGLSSGMPIVMRVAIKPTPSIAKEQKTVNLKENGKRSLKCKG